MKYKLPLSLFTVASIGAVPNLSAQDFQQDLPSEAFAEPDLATKLANPLASLISMPVQANFDQNYGANGNGEVWKINVQPVIPISINEDWNIISRTIVPIIEQSGFSNSEQNKSGIGDTLQSIWLSPVEPVNSWIVGLGGAFLLPTATNDVLGGEKWGLGPTAVALKQQGHWTYGALTNHLWDVSGNSSRRQVNATFIQPFVSYVTDTKTTISLNTESSYDWPSGQWTAPVNLIFSQMLKAGEQPLQVFVGTRYWLDAPETGPDGWGLRIGFTLLFPK